MVSSEQCISSTTRRMMLMGQGEPAMIPVRSELRSNSRKRACSSSAINMVGTPWMAAQRSSAMAWSVASASKYSAGITMAAPCATHTMLPRIMPKQ